MGGGVGAAGGVPKQQQEEHARNYVKKIKARFSAQSHVYQAFLDILHTFLNKEQSAVYDRVAVLFVDHPDLLEEFKQFLPPPSSTTPTGGASSGAPSPLGSGMGGGAGGGVGGSAAVAAAAAAAAASSGGTGGAPLGSSLSSGGLVGGAIPPSLSSGVSSLPSMGGEEEVGGRGGKGGSGRKSKELHSGPMLDYNARKGKRARKSTDDKDEGRGKGDGERGKAEEDEASLDPGIRNRRFFAQLKRKADSDELYDDIIKLLHLFNSEVLTYTEMIVVLRDLLEHRCDLYHRFRHFTGMRDQEGGSLSLTGGMNPFETTKRVGPSYRALPKSYRVPHCSGKTMLGDQVLNNTWVSSPTGREDAGFRATRKNQYEEELFKCEDQRCELDLAIEMNAGAVFALEKVMGRMKKVKREEERKRFRLREGDVKILHVRAIDKIYGDRGAEVVEALFSNPMVAIPVIVKRLKQKDLEWRRARREFQKVWRETNEKNYLKALDHQGAYFKQGEKKALSAKVLLSEIRKKYQEQLKSTDVCVYFYFIFILFYLLVFKNIYLYPFLSFLLPPL